MGYYIIPHSSPTDLSPHKVHDACITLLPLHVCLRLGALLASIIYQVLVLYTSLSAACKVGA